MKAGGTWTGWSTVNCDISFDFISNQITTDFNNDEPAGVEKIISWDLIFKTDSYGQYIEMKGTGTGGEFTIRYYSDSMLLFMYNAGYAFEFNKF